MAAQHGLDINVHFKQTLVLTVFISMQFYCIKLYEIIPVNYIVSELLTFKISLFAVFLNGFFCQQIFFYIFRNFFILKVFF